MNLPLGTSVTIGIRPDARRGISVDRLLSLRAALLGLALLLSSASAYGQAQPAAPRPTPEQLAEQEKEAIARFERYVFPDGDNVIRGLSPKKETYYSLLGYIGGERGFTQLMFQPFVLQLWTRLSKHVFYGPYTPSDDILGVLTDGPPNDTQVKSISLLMGVPSDTLPARRDNSLFDGACLLSHLYVQGGPEKTIAFINVLRNVTPDDSVTARESIVPAACLAAGIASHLGIRNVKALRPDELIELSESDPKIRYVHHFITGIIYDLYSAGITEGMSRDEAVRRVTELLDRDNKRLLEQGGLRNGGD